MAACIALHPVEPPTVDDDVEDNNISETPKTVYHQVLKLWALNRGHHGKLHLMGG